MTGTTPARVLRRVLLPLIPTAHQLFFALPPHRTPLRIIKSADQPANIFLRQKPKMCSSSPLPFIFPFPPPSLPPAFLSQVRVCVNANEVLRRPEERARIVDAICARGGEMVMHRVQQLGLSALYRSHHRPQALRNPDRRVHAITELSWTPPAPPICVVALAFHKTGSLAVQHAFENLESAKDGIVDELLGQGRRGIRFPFWSSSIQFLNTGRRSTAKLRLLEFAPNEQGSKSVIKALKEGGKETLDRVVQRNVRTGEGCSSCDDRGSRALAHGEPADCLCPSYRTPPFTWSSQPDFVIPTHVTLYNYIRGHIVTPRGCKTGSKVIWLLCIHPIQFLLYPPSCVFFSNDYYGYQTYIRSFRFACMTA
ncbi:hypothetical protein B0H14DRAFT_3600148 [Mycena olivaceomarginata]|nr:hypothetical protein B0H14DRAFT_3600148 [Mycena olivaceomarginata]